MRRLGLLFLVLVFGCTMQAKPGSPAAGRSEQAPDFELPVAAAPAAPLAAPVARPGDEPDVRGQRIAVLVDRPRDSGTYTISLVGFDGSVLASTTAR